MTYGSQLPTTAELRAIISAIHGRSLPSRWTRIDRERDSEPDERLLEVMAEPFDSVSDTHERLGDGEAHLRARSDRRSVFLTVYTEMTANVSAGIESGMFDDPEWVRDYLVTFANQYRTALVDSERETVGAVPPAWRLAFQAPRSGFTVLIQDALLGISAHINHDLAYALRDAGVDPDRSSKLRDHNRINRILQRLIDVVQRALADVYEARGYTRIDTLLGSFDEDFTLVGLTEARWLAWRNAVLLTDARSTVLQRIVDWRIRAISTGAGYFILRPSTDPALLWTLRRIERESSPVEPFRKAIKRRLEERGVNDG